MDRIAKALKKLTAKERKNVKEILKKIVSEDTKGLSIQKLKDQKNIFRARKGDLRIIYKKQDDTEFLLLAIERRSEKTYKRL